MKVTGIKNNRGSIFATVLILTAIFVFGTTASFNMVSQDVQTVKLLKNNVQAKFIAEAGINIALGKIAAAASLSVLPISGSIGEGSYVVSVRSAAGRQMLSSVGTIVNPGRSNATATVETEITTSTPTSMNYIMSAGNNINILAGVHNAVVANGQMHANNGVHFNTANGQGDMTISGTLTYTNDNVYISVGNGANCYISVNGTVIPRKTTTTKPAWWAVAVTMPAFNNAYYKNAAISGGTYYSSSQTFNAVSLTPGNGLVYVEGTATFLGTCNLTGGIIASQISVSNTNSTGTGKLYQHKAGNYNMIVANGSATVTGDVNISGELHTEEALIYAKNDVCSRAHGTVLDVTGVITAQRNIDLSNFQTTVTYTHTYPDVMLDTVEPSVDFISWNK